ncbi:GTP 3',8-cyclase MoaA [Alkalicoccus luteus]|uniref:GTP 3',8-cyclase MoaA n=1 Tax=Alkalicoccus luteus TaxID=1237094 RepID=UPI004033659D
MLTDKRNRPLRDLRISVTDQCNLRCRYCMPKEIFDDHFPFLGQDQLLTFDEIVKIVHACRTTADLKKLRITGGEPLLRKNLTQLIERLRTETSIDDIAMTTNGILLPKKAHALKEAGLSRVSVSLDSLDDSRFQAITGRTLKVAHVLNGINAAREAGLPVKLNMVVKKGMNEEDILPMVERFKGTGIIVRFIEYMDVGNANGWKLDHVLSKAEIVDKIHNVYPLEEAPANSTGETASRFRFRDGSGEIGVISSVSDAFCASCNRARLTADGQFITCLFASKGHDLKELLRNGSESIEDAVAKIWTGRQDQYSEDRLKHTASRKKVEMHRVGG